MNQPVISYCICCLFLFGSALGLAQSRAISDRIANYNIQVELDTVAKKITASESILWKNPSADTIREMQFHLYLNAFRNNRSTFMKEWGEIPDVFRKNLVENCEWSWIDIKKLKDEAGNDLMPAMSYIHPDDDNEEDRTVLRVVLAEPVLPYDSIRLQLDWITRIPKTMVRTGYNLDYYFMAQWFPKLGVYEPAGMRYATEGSWNCHQYHAKGEYYADFGVYEVEINVPKDFVVGASGVMIDEQKLDTRDTYTFRAEDVIDFTWSASPYFEEIKTEWKGVELRLLVYPAHVHFAERYFTSIKNSLSYFEKYFERYPYPILTIVDPPFHGIFSTGMEYPMLITTGSFCLLPEGVRTTETLAVHEFIHQYFMQMIATHEQEEPWLDEGFTTYYEGRIMDHYYGEHESTVDVLGIQFGNKEYNRAEFFAFPNIEIAENARPSWQFKHGGYGRISYNKTAIWLCTLEGIIGRETMDEIMKTYFQRWKFKHPCGKDFIAIVNEVVQKNHGEKFGENLDWFFDQVLYGTEECDYTVADIENIKMLHPVGVFEEVENCVGEEKNENGSPRYQSKVVLHRLGEMMLPVEILIQFEDGKTVTELWDGKARSKEFAYTGSTRIACAEIDPARKIFIDKNFINNSRSTKVQETGIRKHLNQFMVWMQNAMMSFGALI